MRRSVAPSASWFASISPLLLSSVLPAVTERFGATIEPPLFVSDPLWMVSFEPAPIWPPSLFSVPLARLRSAFESSLPFELSSVFPTVAARPVWPRTRPAALPNAPAWATTRPLLWMVPPAFEIAPAPWPASSVSVPMPAWVIVPPSLSRVAGASVKSVLLVCSVPPAELSSVPDTATFIGPLPVCVIVPA
ncbi:hypothetical protein LMG28614_06573 [Paraburkholderia ultramafica]|uniref:Uncharacterized protein n=1 Tax=Paraburkholderia ultramafica TaxID=1544867 RepID=A0A6S7BQ38_9BURK|nr:hypothetical protein LMG28614_06573 [Paraburkholderia ultramafica]